jgi:capsular polysaccharide transport system permease protein
MLNQMDFAPTPLELIKAQWRVILALMLRDIKTRFGSTFGFLIAIAWPISHILVLLVIYTVAGRAVPYGDSPALWFATGIVPFMAFSYVSRFMVYGMLQNRPLLAFPLVKITDVLFARAIIEILNTAVVILILAIIFWSLEIDFMPIHTVQACSALGAAILLGLGAGTINGIIALAIPIWATGYFLTVMVLWIASGVLFVPSVLPESVRYPLSFNPALHAVEWMRLAYYEGYSDQVFDKTYVIAFAMLLLCGGLIFERMMRGRLLQH